MSVAIPNGTEALSRKPRAGHAPARGFGFTGE